VWIVTGGEIGKRGVAGFSVAARGGLAGGVFAATRIGLADIAGLDPLMVFMTWLRCRVGS
jgi:hypothetical protein